MSMVFTKAPKRGDAVIGDLTTKEVLFLRGDALVNANEIDATKYEIIGGVAHRRGDEVLIVHKDKRASKKWSERYSFKLTGYTLDGTARQGSINLWTSGTVVRDTTYVISYNASDADSLVEQLNAAFSDSANYPAFVAQDWFAENNDSEITVACNFTDYRQASNTGSAGFTLTANLLPDVSALANVRRRHGGNGGEGTISSYYRALYYFNSDIASSTYNPATTLTNYRTIYPVCKPAYLGTSTHQSDHCAILRARYGEGEEGWKRYMQAQRAQFPTDWGNVGMRNGLERTSLLASKVYSTANVTDKVMCPAAEYAYNTATECLPVGSWGLPTVEDLCYILDDIQYPSHSNDRKSDALNAVLLKIGGAVVGNNQSFWSCLRFSANLAWHAYGGSGFFYSNLMYYSCVALPVSLYKLA